MRYVIKTISKEQKLFVWSKESKLYLTPFENEADLFDTHEEAFKVIDEKLDIEKFEVVEVIEGETHD